MLSPESPVRISTALCLAPLKPRKAADTNQVSTLKFLFISPICCSWEIEDGQMQGFMLQRCAYPACRISLQLLTVHKLLEKRVVTDGARALWRDVEVVFFDSCSVFSNKNSLCYSILPRDGTHIKQ